MQVDPTKPKLKPPGTKRLKLKCDVPKSKPPGVKCLKPIRDDPLSNFAFNFNLRRYGEVLVTTPALSTMPPPAVPVVIAPSAPFLSPPAPTFTEDSFLATARPVLRTVAGRD